MKRQPDFASQRARPLSQRERQLLYDAQWGWASQWGNRKRSPLVDSLWFNMALVLAGTVFLSWLVG